MSRLKELGEDGLLALVPSWIKTRNPMVKTGIGDDALVLEDGTVVSSDSYSAGIHFSLEFFSPEDIGFKTAGATLSDLAAMGADPLCILVNLFLPAQMDSGFLKRLYAGMEEVASEFNAEIAGGDTVASETLALSLTALGKAKKPMLRCGARSGDSVYISGFPGLSVVGLRVLSMLSRVENFEEAKERHLRPRPRIELGKALTGKATACMDVSDGISTDAMRMAKASKVKLVIEKHLLPVHDEVTRYKERFGERPEELILNGGEDYELLFTAPSNVDVPANIGDLSIHRIGRVEDGKGAYLEVDGELKPLESCGWDHFR